MPKHVLGPAGGILNGADRKLYDEISTRDGGVYARFVAANICAAPLKEQKINTSQAMSGFNVHAQAFSASDFTIARIKVANGRVQVLRAAAEIASDTEHRYTLNLPISGSVELDQFGREAHCSAGSLIMMSGSEKLALRKSADNNALLILLPQDFVEARIVKTEEKCARETDVGGMRRLVFSTAAALQEEAATLTPDELEKSISVVSELALLALGQLADARSSDSPVRAANLTRVKRIIRARCDNPDLTLDDIAAECGLSLRYLHLLFQVDSTTFREYIIHERLHRARQLLETSPGTTSITDIALAVGFCNLSHFSTAFRRLFAMAPRDVLRKSNR